MDKNFIMMCKTATEHLIEHKSISEKQSISMFGINGSAVSEKLKEIGVGETISTIFAGGTVVLIVSYFLKPKTKR